MSDTEESYSTTGAESTESGAPDASPEAAAEDSPIQGDAGEIIQPEEEEEKGEVEPEPEPNPLDGLTYEDDPDLDLPPYAEKSYWEKRYQEDKEVFEWYQEPDVLLPICKELVDADKKVLIIGNGNSDLPVVLNQNGFENITAIDFAKPAVVKSRRRNAEVEGITWKIMDIRKMTRFENGEFQAIVDKATLDCLFYAGEEDVLTAMAEISRVLRKRGVYICVSCAPPEERRKFFDRPADLLLELEKVLELKKPLPSDEPHYVYIIRKGGKLLT